MLAQWPVAHGISNPTRDASGYKGCVDPVFSLDAELAPKRLMNNLNHQPQRDSLRFLTRNGCARISLEHGPVLTHVLANVATGEAKIESIGFGQLQLPQWTAF